MEVLGSARRTLQGGPDVGCGRARGHATGGPWRTHTQSEGRRRLAAPRHADHRHRRQRLGQVEPRLRHDLRRRPAALRRVAVGLRPPVPGADGEARRRPDRGHLPGHRDSTEEQHPQPAVDGGHHDRDPRLHAPALGARRAHLLPQLRQRGHAARRPRWSRGAWRPCPRARGCWWASRCPSSACPTRRCPPIWKTARRWTRPPARGGRTDPLRETLQSLAKRGFRRLLVDGRAVTLEEVDVASLGSRDDARGRRRSRGRGRRRAGAADRLDRDRLSRGRRRGLRGRAGAAEAEAPVVHQFSERFECRRCHILYEDPQPRLFSFNNPFGACPTCHGFGNVIELDLDLVVPDKTKSIRGGAIEPWTKPHYRAELATLKRDAKRLGHRARHAVAGSDRRAAPRRRRRRRRRLRGHPRVLRVARAQEIQGARPRVPEPVPRLPDVPGLRRHAAAPRGARRARVGQDHRPRLGDDGQRGAGVLRHARP